MINNINIKESLAKANTSTSTCIATTMINTNKHVHQFRQFIAKENSYKQVTTSYKQ
jgi:hypothetical protein